MSTHVTKVSLFKKPAGILRSMRIDDELWNYVKSQADGTNYTSVVKSAIAFKRDCHDQFKKTGSAFKEVWGRKEDGSWSRIA